MRSTLRCACALAFSLSLVGVESLVAQQPGMRQPSPGSWRTPPNTGGAPGNYVPPNTPPGTTAPASAPPPGGVPAGEVQQASHAGSLADQAFAGEALYSDGPYYDGGGPIMDDGFGSCGPGGCTHCGTFGCGGCGPFGQGCLSGLYVRADWLLWSVKGMDLPPLVTTSPQGTPRFDAGVLGEAGTDILFGGDTVGSNTRPGGRITFGRWFDPCQRLGVEADYFAIDDESTSFSATSDGNPILARPFFDVTLGTNSAELVAFPNVIRGTVAAEHVNSFQGGGVRAMYNLCCGDGCGTSCLSGCMVQTGYRFDLLMGYRFLRVDDRIGIVEDLTSAETASPGSFFIRDEFTSQNEFHGWDFGTALHFCKGCWSLDLLSKVAVGTTRSDISIDGSTIITEGGESETFEGGLLAQRTNIGDYTNHEFAMVPELGFTVGYQLNPCWRLTAGYSFIYWSKVYRAGDQIDLDLNPDLLPPEEGEVDENLRPRFRLVCDDFWAQGLALGVEGKW